MPLDNIRKDSSKIKEFLKALNVTDTTFSLYERMLDFRDDAFVSTLNSIIDEKITIEDTNPELAKNLEIDTLKTSTPSPKMKEKAS